MRRWLARRSPRLAGYDYDQPGLYFITVCTHNREPVLASVIDGGVHLLPPGVAAQDAWEGLPLRFPRIDLDAFVIMPNHVHGILVLGDDPDLPTNTAVPSLPTVLRVFKSISGIQGNRALGRDNQPFWQRSFHDRIIRNERELRLIRAYIADNPYCWDLDIENPLAPS